MNSSCADAWCIDDGGRVFNGVRTPVFLNAIAVSIKQDISELTAGYCTLFLSYLRKRDSYAKFILCLCGERGEGGWRGDAR